MAFCHQEEKRSRVMKEGRETEIYPLSSNQKAEFQELRLSCKSTTWEVEARGSFLKPDSKARESI